MKSLFDELKSKNGRVRLKKFTWVADLIKDGHLTKEQLDEILDDAGVEKVSL